MPREVIFGISRQRGPKGQWKWLKCHAVMRFFGAYKSKITLFNSLSNKMEEMLCPLIVIDMSLKYVKKETLNRCLRESSAPSYQNS